MRPDELIITGDSSLVDRIQLLFRGRLAISPRWLTSDQFPLRLLIVDVAVLSRSDWDHMLRWSRSPFRPTLILIDDGDVPRERLALVTAEALIAFGATDIELQAQIEEHAWEHPFRVAAFTVAAADIPHPLAVFLRAAFMERCMRVSTLARSLGINESTLRNQWGRFRCDPTLRLEDILKQIDAMKAVERRTNRLCLSTSLESLLFRIGVSPVQ